MRDGTDGSPSETGGPDATSPDQAASEFRPAMTEAERTAAFTTGRTPVDRGAALRAGRTPVPRKVIVGIALGFAVIGLGGVVLEHYFGNVGVVASATTTAPGPNGAPLTPAPPVAPPIGAPLDAFLGLKQLGRTVAPIITLRDQSGADWSLQHQAGKVVVLTFFDTGCNDICSVLSAEISQAAALLGPKTADVEFAIVNSDPRHTAVQAAPAALTVSDLQSDPNVHFLTGSLPALNAIWINYGVTVTVSATTTQQTHNNILYFIDPQGYLRSLALPFANENQRGGYELPQSDIRRFAQGIARTAANLSTRP